MKISWENCATFITVSDDSGNVVIRCKSIHTDIGENESLIYFVMRHGGPEKCADKLTEFHSKQIANRPNNWQEFTAEISEADLHECIANYRKWKVVGAIGECTLRRIASKWQYNINYSVGISTAMQNIANFAYEYFYHNTYQKQ